MNAPSLRCLAGADWLILLMILILLRRGDLVERGVRHLVAIYFRRTLDDALQRAQHGRIGIAAIGFRVLFLLPQTDRDGFISFGREKRDLVLEPSLLAQHRENVVLQHLREFRAFIGLEMQRHIACVHVDSLALRQREDRCNNTTLLDQSYRTVLSLSSESLT